MLPCIGKGRAQGAQLRGFLHLAYPCVDGGYLVLVGLEISVGLLTVEYGRDEILPVVPSRQQTRIGGEETKVAALLILHYEHSEHLSSVCLLLPFRPGGEVLLQLGSGSHTERMRSVVEGEGEACGGFMYRCYGVKSVVHNIRFEGLIKKTCATFPKPRMLFSAQLNTN